MNEKMNISQYIQKHRLKSKRFRILIGIAVIIVFVTTYMLILPAITQTHDFCCGLEEHQHTEACYSIEKTLICQDESEGHQHSEECYEETSTLICTLPEHVHNSDCYVKPDQTQNESDEADTVEVVNFITEDTAAETAASAQQSEEALSIAKTFEGKDFEVTASYEKDAEIPKDAELVVSEYLQGTAEYDAYLRKAREAVNVEEDADITFAKVLDISFMSDGQEIEPKSEVKVSITYDEPVVIPENSSSVTVHFPDDGEVELLATEAENSKETGKVSDLDDLAVQSADTFVFTTESFSTVVNLVVPSESKEVTGTYYQRVSEIDSTEDQYLIVSADYSMALTTGTNHATHLSLKPVDGNPGYFTIQDQIRNSYLWTFGTAKSRTSNIGSVSNNNYLNIGNGSISLGNSTALTLNYDSAKKAWSIRQNNNYLSSTDNSFTGANRNSVPETADVIILKRMQNTTLSVPDYSSVSSSDSGEGGGDIAHKDQPVYPAYINTSSSKTGATAIENVEGQYYSDPATSQIESQFTSKEQDTPTKNDGKVLTDKSVQYGGDDYGAFGNYLANTFSATLSVLGQDYKLKQQNSVKIPIDVSFILDVSGSMEGNKAGNVTRTQAVVTAVNDAMKQIMEDNPENRASVVLYSSGGNQLLPLDHYTPASGSNYLEYSGGDVYSANGLKGSAGTVIQRTNAETNGFTQGHGTYTQYGIALGAKALFDKNDTTYTATLDKNTDYEKQVIVSRQPVVILLSDGDPTHCTPNYSDVLNGPHYGSGVYTNSNNKGIQGFYTILSANYYKDQIGFFYNKKAKMYTIGMGINQTGYADMSNQSYTGDHYKRAVLNPTADNISALTNNNAKNHADTADMLKSLLSSSYTPISVTTGSTGSYSNLGTTHQYVPVIQNPYTKYSYSDGAYFGTLSADELKKIFGGIIASNINAKQYGFILKKGTQAVISDDIGYGMQVDNLGQKNSMVLRFNGANYPATSVGTAGNVTTYHYNYQVKTSDGSGVNRTERTYDLNQITITVTKKTGDGGKEYQEVKMVVPEEAMPSYTPDEKETWYYEMLPVRLIYQVGLTEQSKEAVQNLPPGQEAVYYTNQYAGNEAKAYSTQSPHADNPYYYNVTYSDGTQSKKAYKDYVVNKRENTTETSGTSVNSKESSVGGSTQIRAALGNNGKLVFSVPEQKVTINVEKTWGSGVSEKKEIQVGLYKVNASGQGEAVRDESGNQLTLLLNEQNSWKASFTDLDTLEEGSYYAVKELTDGYKVTYNPSEFVNLEGQMVYCGRCNIDENDQAKIIINNDSPVVLPETGGSGTLPYLLMGILMMSAALISGFMLRRKREERAE